MNMENCLLMDPDRMTADRRHPIAEAAEDTADHPPMEMVVVTDIHHQLVIIADNHRHRVTIADIHRHLVIFAGNHRHLTIPTDDRHLPTSRTDQP